ncbi:MAG: hypothetical protein IJB19_01630 [Clostridia bacterium]|nr:hypothetical protein [Clostridia bacterium]
MKHFNVFQFAFCIFIIVMYLVVSASAYEKYEEFEVEPASPEDEQRILKLNNFSLFSGENEKANFSQVITSFDISDSKKIALGLKDGCVLVMDTDGNILWWMSFNQSGAIYVRWQKETLLVSNAKFSTLYEFTSTGSYIKSSFIITSSRINNSTNLDILRQRSITVDEEVFSIKKGYGIFSTGYSKLVKTDSSGNETVLYNVESSVIATNIVWAVILILLGSGSFVSIKQQTHWPSNQDNTGHNTEDVA